MVGRVEAGDEAVRRVALPRQLGEVAGELLDLLPELRRPDWFDREYGLPFAQWPARTARAATVAFRAAAATMEASETQVDVERAITLFVDVINGMPNIDTVEREDVAEAVCKLADMSPFELPDELALKWFDAAREF